MKTNLSLVFKVLRRGADLIGALMFLAIFLAFLLQIVARYFLNWPLGWPDEVIAILYVWVVFWGGAFMVGYDQQISFDLVQNALPAKIRKWIAAAIFLITGLLFLSAVPVTADYVVFAHRQTTAVLELPLSIVYVPFLLFLAVWSVRLGLRLSALLRGVLNPVQK